MLITESELKVATGEKTLTGLIKWCKKNGISFIPTKNGIVTTETALNSALFGANVEENEPNWDAVI